MRILLLFIVLVNVSIQAMDEIIITLVDVHANAKEREQEKRLRFAQEKNALLARAEEDVEKGMLGLLGVSLWLGKMFCMNGPTFNPTLSDVYVLGCMGSASCSFCVAASCECCAAMMIKQE